MSTQIDLVSKSLPLSFAKKLCDRTHDYFRLDHTFPGTVHKSKVLETHKDEVIAKQQLAELDLKMALGIDSDSSQPDTRLLPWKKELDDYMFYL
jgi:hypothetical protein